MDNPLSPGFYTSDELRGFGFAYVGDNVRVARNCVIVYPQNVAIGDHSRIDAFTGIFATSGRLRIGRRVHIGGQCHFAVAADLAFEDYSGASQGVRIYTGSDDYSGGALIGPCVPEEYRNCSIAPVTVGRFAVLGASSVVLPGVMIGEGATVGALSLVNRDLEPWGTYAGQPAKRYGWRPRLPVAYAAEIDARDARIESESKSEGFVSTNHNK